MFRVLAMSDLHLEFAEFRLEVRSWPDLVVLAGDIGHGTAGIKFARQQIPRSVPVIILAGNHEFYGSSIEAVISELRAAAEDIDNLHFLDCDELTIAIANSKVRILGATLWTDFELRGRAFQKTDMALAGRRINDFRLIQFRGRSLTPQDTVVFHEAARDWLSARLQQQHDGPTIVATHHSPSARSEQPRYAGGELTSAFHSELDWMIQMFQPNLWIHGHSHWSVDYNIGRTRVFSNQRGYPGEQCGFDIKPIHL